MGLKNHAYFQVATKLLLRKNDEVLALITPDDYLDFPGGRIDESEVDLPLNIVAKREIEEELGTDVKYKLGNVAFVTKRHYTHNEQNFRIFAIYYEAEYLGGDFELSEEHKKYRWAKPVDLLKGNHKYVSKDEEESLKEYFAKN